MTKYPNREALRKAHDIYRDAMREFIFQYLEKRVENETVDDLIMRVLNREQQRTIDIKGISVIFRNRECWNDFFSQKFEYDRLLGRHRYDIRSVTSLIVMGRNQVSHPGSRDLDFEYTCTHLFLIAEVLGEVGKTQAKTEVKEIWDELFSDDAEERIANLTKQLEDMLNQLNTVEAEKTKYGKALKAASNRLAALRSVNAQLEERLETTTTRLEDVEAELTACKKDLARTLRQLDGTKAGQTEYLSLEERPALLKGNEKTTTPRREYLSPEERLARALTESEKEETEKERVEIAKRVAELRLNPDASRKMSWKSIREEVLLTNDEFHENIRISDYYREIMLERLCNLIDEGWVYNGCLNILCGFDVPEEFVERMESNKAKAKGAEPPSYRGDTAKSPKYQRRWRRPGAVAALRDPAEIREAEAKIANILNPSEKTRLELELREAKRAVYDSEI